MIHLSLLLFLGGAVGAVWRSHRKSIQKLPTSLPAPYTYKVEEDDEYNTNSSTSFDDVGELRHYQKVSWYAMAFTSSGWLFYPPATMLATPLLGYNAYNFVRSLGNSSSLQRKSALTIFELIGIGTTLMTGKPLATSMVMLFAFGRRNMLLQAGNISNNLSPTEALQFQDKSYWVLREGAEIETCGAQLQESDIIVFSANDVITVEGVVVQGKGEVRQIGLNKKMKTVCKSIGDRVYPFTHLQRGSLQIKQKKH